MIRISLTEEEKSELRKLRLNRKSNIGERAYYVLLSSDGKTAPEIAKHCSRNIITIRLWLKNYIKTGIFGLKSTKPPGRTAKKGDFVVQHIDDLLSKIPNDYGYKEAGWQLNIFIDYFTRIGCAAGKTTIRKALKDKGYVFKRFSKSTPKNAPTAVQKKETVARIVEKIQGASSNNTEVFFLDESHFSNQPYVNRGWFKQGEKNG